MKGMLPSLYLLQLSDSHLQASVGERYYDCDVQGSFEAVLEHMEKHHPRAGHLLLSGDIVHHGHPEAYHRVAKAIQKHPFVSDWIPGNHDDGNAMASILGQRRLAFDAGRWRIVLLDSTDLPDGKGGGSLSTCEMKRLEAELTNHGDRLFLIVLHHQPMPVGSDWQDEIGLGNASAFWQMLERYPQQKCLLFGHLHQEWQLNQGQNRLLGCPSTAVQFRKGCAAFELETQGIEAHPGYRWLQLFDSGQVITGIERLELA